MKKITRRRRKARPARTRKQPRRLTPPLFLRDAETSERTVIDLDDETRTFQAQKTGRITAYLRFAPGLRIRVKSRCVTKRRFTELHIEPAEDPIWALLPSYLIDHCEGETISEEFLQHTVAAMLADKAWLAKVKFHTQQEEPAPSIREIKSRLPGLGTPMIFLTNE